MFFDIQSGNEEIVLLDVARDPGQRVRVDGSAVEVALAQDLEFARVAERQTVEQRRLPCPAGAHDGQKFARSYHSSN